MSTSNAGVVATELMTASPGIDDLPAIARSAAATVPCGEKSVDGIGSSNSLIYKWLACRLRGPGVCPSVAVDLVDSDSESATARLARRLTRQIRFAGIGRGLARELGS